MQMGPQSARVSEGRSFGEGRCMNGIGSEFFRQDKKQRSAGVADPFVALLLALIGAVIGFVILVPIFRVDASADLSLQPSVLLWIVLTCAEVAIWALIFAVSLRSVIGLWGRTGNAIRGRDVWELVFFL